MWHVDMCDIAFFDGYFRMSAIACCVRDGNWLDYLVDEHVGFSPECDYPKMIDQRRPGERTNTHISKFTAIARIWNAIYHPVRRDVPR